MKIQALGEFGLIERIQRVLPVPGKDVMVGIGDDVAFLDAGNGRAWLATCDVQMEGAHFLRNEISPYELGQKALAINLSDIAAKGGVPKFALVSLGLPNDLEVDFIEELYAGMRLEAEQFRVDIVGGNISRSKLGLFIDIFLLGYAQSDNLLLRSGAQIGDKILVTGTLGDAAAGVALMLDETLKTSEAYASVARLRYHLPTPRVPEGHMIVDSRQATSMMDISDGLASDLGHICEQSHVGARIFADKLPVSPENRNLALRSHKEEFHFALYGGEDYELIFTLPADQAETIAREINRETKTPVSVVGDILPENEGRQLVLPDKIMVPLEPRGWDHFKS